MTSCMNLSIYTGAMSIILPKFNLEELLQTIKDMQPTSFRGVPTMYIAITNHPDMAQYDVDSIGICISGIAPMPGEILLTFEWKSGAKILEGYGLAERFP